ncbi:phosphoenolpyruvate-utilizing N-terminal domain-containing protein [Brooklawnia cerclae]|uniref:Phosphoenolpyruvate-protein phosphotransferase n=1 Tax=Brooklawnia cerclae TaxID=349934 RepID=A0ABX0SKA5_9ACTN|nr:phosphotransferase system enzyme I (PtsI) [Brooklawnia cerclae]
MTSSRVLHGIGVGSTATVGPCVRFSAPVTAPADEPRPSSQAEIDEAVRRLTDALQQVAEELEAAADANRNNETLGAVLQAAAEMAGDPELKDRSLQLIRTGVGPATAITRVVGEFADVFREIGGYMAERVGDLHSVRDRAVARVLGVPEPGLASMDAPGVVVALELTPADTSTLDMDKVLALVTQEGGPTSHTAIIARQMGLPCVVKVDGAADIPAGTLLAVDGAHDRVVVDPDEATQAEIRTRMANRSRLLDDTEPGATADGHRVQLLANIGTVADAEQAAATAVEGVGLFRTEFLFLDESEEPTVDNQAEAYRQVLAAFAGRKVVIRTLDAGADKPLAFANTTPEENPALGIRAFRLARRNPQLLAHQLEALARAVADTPQTEAWVMAPMISTADEAKDFREMANAAGLDHVGIMVEVPAVALQADRVLTNVQFASIGTNDLAQYTMASDRQLGALADLIDRWQPAVLKLVAQTAAAGQRLGRPVGVCGESASDPLMALVLAGLGITSLSMSIAAVPEVRFALRHTTLDKCQEMARAALDAADAKAAQEAVRSRVTPEVKEALALD